MIIEIEDKNQNFDGSLEGKLLDMIKETVRDIDGITENMESEFELEFRIVHDTTPRSYNKLDIEQYSAPISSIDEAIKKISATLKGHLESLAIRKRDENFIKSNKRLGKLKKVYGIQFEEGDSFNDYWDKNHRKDIYKGVSFDEMKDEYNIISLYSAECSKMKEKELLMHDISGYANVATKRIGNIKKTIDIIQKLRSEDIKISAEDVDQYLLMVLDGELSFSRALKEIRTDPSKIEVEFKPGNPPVYTTPAVKKEPYVAKTVDTDVIKFLKGKGIKGAYAKELAERNDITSIMGFMGKLETTMEAFGMDSSEAHPIYTKHKNLLLANGREQERYLDTLATLYVIRDPNNCSGILPRNAKDAYESAQSLRKLLPSGHVIIDSDSQAVPGWRAEKIAEMFEKDPFTGKYLDESGIRTMNLALFGNSQKDWLQPEGNSHFRVITTHSEKMFIQLTATRNNIGVKVMNYSSNFN